MAEAEIKRLSKVAKELNVGITNIVEFLADKGQPIDRNPNTKISSEQFDLLLSAFQSDKVSKEEAQKIAMRARPAKETLTIEDAEVKKVERVVEQEEILIKGNYVPEEAPAAEVKPAAKVVAETAPPAAPPKESAKEEPKGDGSPQVKVLGKIDLDSMNLKTKPDKKTKAAKEKEVAAEAAPKTKGRKKKTDVVEEVPVAAEETAPVEASTPAEEVSAPTSDEPVTPEEITLYRAKTSKLEGPTILGKMVLPVKEEKKKTPPPAAPGQGQGGAGAHDKKKRKRIKTGAVNTANFKAPIVDKTKPQGPGAAQGQRPGASPYRGGGAGGGRGGYSRPAAPATSKAPLTDEEIQKQIKETLARLSGQGKSKSAKYRRDKRDEYKQGKEEAQMLAEEQSKTLKVTEFVSANELAKMMDIPVTKIISTCMSLGMFVSINQRLSAEVISIVAEEFGFQLEFVSAEASVLTEDEVDNPEDLVHRAPIVTVMGHVDHGKTSLLDYVRKANVISGEAGGITQHIGAYSVDVHDNKRIAFLDTPGHEAFTAMRARGAQITDVVIVVIAADDSVMPQTKEAINHAQAAGVPIVFALNKVDKPDANPDKIREQLSAMNILVEEWGGKFQSQEISAKKGTNIDALLDKVLLEADLLDLKSNPNKPASGTIVESMLDKGRGYVATMMVQNGTLKIGDLVLAGSAYGRVKALHNERGQAIKSAGPSTPVQLLGLNGAPQAGDKFKVFEDEREAKEIATKRLQLQREQGIRTHKHITLDEIGRRLAIGDFKELNIIVKGDVDGSIEALTDALLKLSTDNVQVNVIHKSVGGVTESDVMLASASNAIIVAFQVRPSANARRIAEQEEIDIRTYSIIYDAINEVKAAMEGMLAPKFEEKVVCNIEIREVFKITKVGTIAGCMVLDGKVTRNTKVRVIRDWIVVHTGSLGSLKRFKDDVKEVTTGYECGLNIDNFNDIASGDIIEGYDIVEIKKKL